MGMRENISFFMSRDLDVDDGGQHHRKNQDRRNKEEGNLQVAPARCDPLGFGVILFFYFCVFLCHFFSLHAFVECLRHRLFQFFDGHGLADVRVRAELHGAIHGGILRFGG